MARNMYGATSADFTITSGGRVIPGAVLTLWTARTGGTQITDLLDVDSVACTTVTSAADGSVVYYGPNNDKTVHWADSGQGSRIAIRPVDITGEPPTLTVGTVTTGTADVTISGTSPEYTLDFVLPPVGANGVDTAAIQSKAVTAAKIADDTITAAQIAANAVGSSELADNAVDTNAIADSAVTSAKIADSAVTSAKIADGTITATDVAASTFAAFGTVGNLLTANQASPTTTGGFGVSAGTESSAGVYTVAGVPDMTVWLDTPTVTVGDTYTFYVDATATGADGAPFLLWRTAANALIGSPVQGARISAGTRAVRTIASVAPATAAYAQIQPAYMDGDPGDSLTIHRAGFWKGAGGVWTMPGTPVTNTGIRPNPSNTSEVQVWNSATATWITV